MKTKHTRGPWRVEPMQWNHGESTSITGGSAFVVAEIHSRAWDDNAKLRRAEQRDRANARLIAAAPAMRAELEKIRNLTLTNLVRNNRLTARGMIAQSAIARIEALLKEVDG
jgi:hypothetical protein